MQNVVYRHSYTLAQNPSANLMAVIPPVNNPILFLTRLDRVIEPLAECLTPEAARKIVAIRADVQTQARVDELADKANDGQLTDKERAEYDGYLAWFHVITILQARARTVLRDHATS